MSAIETQIAPAPDEAEGQRGIPTEKFTIAEMPVSEFVAPSGVIDDVTHREVSNGQLIQDIHEAKGHRVWVTGNGVLSPEAKKHNTDLDRSDLRNHQKAAGFMISIRGERPIDHDG